MESTAHLRKLSFCFVHIDCGAYGAFEGSEADYVTLFEPTASMCEQQGKGYIVTSVGKESGSVPFTAFMVKKSTLEKDKALYTRFMRAVSRGQKWVNANDASTIAKTIAKQFPDSDVELLTKVAANYKSVNAWKSDSVMLEKDFMHLQEIISEAGELSKTVPFNVIVDNSIATLVK